MNESNGKKLKKKSSFGVFFDRLLTSKNRKPVVVAAAENHLPEPPKTEGRPTESSQKPFAEANDWYDALSRRQRDYAAAEKRIAELRDRLRAMERATTGGGGCGGGSDHRGCRDESCRAERESLRAQNYRQGVELDALRDRIAILRDERDRLRCDRGVAVPRTVRDGSRGDGTPVLRDEYGGGGGGPVDRSPMLRAAADMQQMIDDNETAIERLIERLENETMSAGRRRDDDRDDSDNDGTVVTTPRTDSSRLQ